MAYVMAKQYEKMPAIPNKHYFKIIAQGYAENGLEQEALERAYMECLQELESEGF